MDKDDIMGDIFHMLIHNETTENTRLFHNIEGDQVVTYEQNGERFLVVIEEL